MLTLNDGRTELWQWDTGRTLAVDADCSQVHFSNKVFGRTIDVDVVDGAAIIPDVLLQTDKDLNVWAFVGTAENGYTKISKTFRVNRRNKPADYVFTPTDQTTLAGLVERIDKIEETQGPDAIKNAVEDYLEQNPVEVPVQSVNGKTGTVELNAEDVGAIAETQLQTAINTALEQAKASGEFDGADGAPGKDGAGGKSAYQYAVEGGYTGTETEFAAKLAEEMPITLPNPNALTFTGAVTGSYDGSAALSVEIPSSGETGNEKDIDFTIEIQENTRSIIFEVDDKNEPLNLTECFILIYYIAGGINTSSTNGSIQFNGLGPITLNSLGLQPGLNYGRPWMLHVKNVSNAIFINAACMNTTGDITSTGVKGANFAYTYGLLFTESEKINKIGIGFPGNTAFGPGSKIRIIGR